MSTTNLRAMVELMRGTTSPRVDVTAAKAELDAIEKAAADMMYCDADEAANRWWEREDCDKWAAAVEVIRSIASEAKR